MERLAVNEAEPEGDDGVVRRVLAGETEAFALIVQRHETLVWRIVAQMGGDALLTENLVQQSFVNAYEHLDQYVMGRDLGRWLTAIARNLVRKELRGRAREHHRLRHYRHYLLAVYDDDDPDRFEQRQRRFAEALDACRQALVADANRALALRYEDGLSVERVADALGRTAAATRQLLFRARAALRLCMERRLAAE